MIPQMPIQEFWNNRNLICVFVVCAVLHVSSCSKKKNSDTDTAATAAEQQQPKSEPQINPYAGVVTGQLSIDSGVPAESIAGATVTVVGQPGAATISETDGSFRTGPTQPGTLELIITSADSTALTNGTAKYGTKIDNVVVTAGDISDIGTNLMKPTGSLTGKVDFLENSNNLELIGSEVFVPGTNFIAKTDVNGVFTLAGLPEGLYSIRAQHEGMSPADLNNIIVTGGITSDLGNIILSISRGPEGKIAIKPDLIANISGANSAIIKNRTVTVDLTYDSDAALMKVSDEPSFLNQSWIPVKQSAEKSFATDGPKSLYVKFSDLNGLESSPYSVSFIIDTEAPSVTHFSLMHGWSQISSTATKMSTTTVATDSGSGVAFVMLSNSSDFSNNSGWLPYEKQYNDWTPAASTWVKVKDHAGNVSISSTDTINQGTYTIIPPGDLNDSLHLRNTQSPFQFTSTVTVTGDLTVDAGVSIYANLSSNSSFIIKGKTQFLGSAASPITITNANNSFNGFDLSQSTYSDNVVNFTNFGNVNTVNVGFIVDGASFSNCNFSPSGYSGILIKKIGFRSASILNSTLISSSGPAIRVEGGTNAVTIRGNQVTGSDMAIQHIGDSGTLVEYNDISSSFTSGMPSPAMAVEIRDKGPIYRRNNIVGGNSSTNAAAIYIQSSASGSFTLEYNNVTASNTSAAGHIYAGSTNMTTTSSYNFYTGCGSSCTVNENPHWLGGGSGTITNNNSQGSAHPTTGSKATGCVGKNCT